MSLKSRREFTAAVAPRYKEARKSQKSVILDEFVESTGYHRKYAISVLEQALLSPCPSGLARPTRCRRRKYGANIEQPFLALWRFSGGLCPKRLVPFLPEFIEVLERFDEISLCPGVKDKLLLMSVSTAERMLQRLRRSFERGIGTTLPGNLLRQQIPIRTYEEWTEHRPGFLEIDLVAHCGGTAAGDYCYTLTMTDIYTGWTECIAVPNRGQIAVCAAVETGRKRLPFPLLGIDSDNGGEFINGFLKSYCDERKITFTRCRPYKKNDQCHVEQKNGAVVRPLVGYARYESLEAAAHLNRLYTVHRLCLNYFEPSMKLLDKSRVGARVKKKYDQPKTPFARLVETISDKVKQEARLKLYRPLNPAQLRRDLADLEAGLRRFAVERQPHAPAGISVDKQTGDLRNVTAGGDQHGAHA